MFLKRKEEEETREKKVGKDDRSFFQKYVSESQTIEVHITCYFMCPHHFLNFCLK